MGDRRVGQAGRFERHAANRTFDGEGGLTSRATPRYGERSMRGPRTHGTLPPRLFAIIRDHLGMRVRGVHRRVSLPLYARDASVRRCDGSCCRHGSVASLDERDRVLSHAELVSQHMTSRVRKRPERWFEARVTRNPDYVCGKAVATRVLDGACVFLRADGLCALQVAAQSAKGASFALKPAMCLLWPLCVTDGKLDVGHAWYTRRKACCAPVRDGEQTIYEVIGPDDRSLRMMGRKESSRGGEAPDGSDC